MNHLHSFYCSDEPGVFLCEHCEAYATYNRFSGEYTIVENG